MPRSVDQLNFLRIANSGPIGEPDGLRCFHGEREVLSNILEPKTWNSNKYIFIVP